MRYIYNYDIFTKENEISFYLLGLFYSDGNVYSNGSSHESSIKSIDISLLSSIRDLVCPNKKISKVKGNNCYKLVFTNKIIFDWLNTWGCVPNKTKILKFPNIPKEYNLHFLRGLIDGDGSIGHYKNPIIRFDSASLELIKGVSELLISLGIKNTISKTKWITCTINGRETKSTTQMYRISLCGLRCYKTLKLIYNNSSIYLDRKKEIADNIIKYYEKKYKLINMSSKDLNSLKWPSDDILVNITIKHKGVLVNAAKELNVNPWSLSQRLRKINKYNYIRELYPIVNIKNINNNIVTKKLKVSLEDQEKIYNLIDSGETYKSIAEKFNLNINYIPFLKRRRYK